MNIIENSTVFLTGADGGIGRAFIKELLNRKAKKIYITGLNIEKLSKISSEFPKKIVPLKLDVTNTEDIQNCVSQCRDVTFLINNAGIELKSSFISEKSANCAKFEMEINYIGVVRVTNAFHSILKNNNQNSTVLNILSIGSLILIDRLATYCASKSAAHIFTQSIRKEFSKDDIKVVGVYPGYVDTSMSSDIELYKISTDELVQNIFYDLENNELNIFPDKMSKSYQKSNKLNLNFH
jgi:short-subunit dehydrogenase